MEKTWKKQGIKSTHIGCLCCGGTDEMLPLETKLYNSFGGWNITKNGQEFFTEDCNKDFNECKTVADLEEMIGDDEINEYLAIVFLPLRGGTYQRHSKNHWVLIEQNEGFA